MHIFTKHYISIQKVYIAVVMAVFENGYIFHIFVYGSFSFLWAGWPVPKVSWWRENALLDDTWEVSSEHVTSTVVSNTLTIGKLQRSDLNARLTCQAANNNITIPVSTTVMLEMNCKSCKRFSIYFYFFLLEGIFHAVIHTHKEPFHPQKISFSLSFLHTICSSADKDSFDIIQ